MSERTSRIESLDALRGFALFGILVVNVQLFSGWGYLDAETRAALPGSGLDSVLKNLIDIFAHGKFYSLFSILFGYSFVMLAGKVGAHPAPHHLRRMLGLFIVGAIHAIFLWPWDILYLYAAVGVLLTPFLRRSPAVLLMWAAILLLLVGAANWYRDAADALVFPWSAAAGDLLRKNLPAFWDGNYADLLAANIELTYAVSLSRMEYLRPVRVLALFLVGAAAARLELAEQGPNQARLLRRCLFIAAPVGLGLALAEEYWSPEEGAGEWVMRLADVVTGPAMAVAYASLLLLWWHRDGRLARAIRRALAPAGRMALTNYLAQSVVSIIVFYDVGFGLFGGRSLGWALAFSAALFLLQLRVSGWWLSHFRQGPMEWLWRWQVTGARPRLLA
jgi:uncharacterized protein